MFSREAFRRKEVKEAMQDVVKAKLESVRLEIEGGQLLVLYPNFSEVAEV